MRLSLGHRDDARAEQERRELEAKLLLGLDARVKRDKPTGPDTPWEDFREMYTTKYLARLRDKSASDTESRLTICERILKPKTIGDVASSEALATLQDELLDGAESRYTPPRPRSPHTVKSHMATVIAALNWARKRKIIKEVPELVAVPTSKLKHMKGRPIAEDEFQAILKATPGVVGEAAAPSWLYLLRGAWQSGLRLDELMHVHWTDPRYIVPVWQSGRLPVLRIPADQQKNATEESIPMLPWLEDVLLETPEGDRLGWVFNPTSLQGRLGRQARHGRPDAEWVGKIISRIGKAAGIIVRHDATGPKYASAHDFRRSLAERLYDAGVPEHVVTQVMRHASAATTRRYYAPGNVQSAALVLQALKVPGYRKEAEST